MRVRSTIRGSHGPALQDGLAWNRAAARPGCKLLTTEPKRGDVPGEGRQPGDGRSLITDG